MSGAPGWSQVRTLAQVSVSFANGDGHSRLAYTKQQVALDLLKNIYVLCPNFQKPGKKQRQINVFYVILHFSREVSHFLCPEPVFSNGVSRRGHAPPRKCGVCRRPLLPGPMAGGIGTISPREKSWVADFSAGEIAFERFLPWRNSIKP